MVALQTLAGASVLAAYAATRSRLRRRRRSVHQRLDDVPTEALPVKAPVTIRWNDHMVPFVEAEHDRDCAVGLGVVHAHLRLAQLEVMRRIARGRVAEVLGPVAVPLDHVLRILDFGRAAPKMLEMAPPETIEWLEGFRDGINHVIEHVNRHRRRLPPELAWLGTRPRAWTLEDLMTIGRLAGSDFTWRVWIPLLRLRGRSDWNKLWERLMADNATPVPSFAGSGAPSLDAFDWIPAMFGRTGSNSFAIGKDCTESGAALLASDPHLSVILPSLWLAAGYRSPSFSCVGLMIPGLPLTTLGRNSHIGWGGTSLHAMSSELFDVSDLPADAIRERRETIPVRWSANREVVIRDTEWGPIVSDLPFLGAPDGKTVALHWVGHLPSDDMTAFLNVNRARNWDEFCAALDGFAIPAQNMIYADAEGHVGQGMAARLPRRPSAPPGDLILPREARRHWESFVVSRDLPRWLDPPRGFVASANNRPEVPMDVPVSFFFSPSFRVDRISEFLERAKPVSVDDVKSLQQDVMLPAALELRDRLLALAEADPRGDPLVQALTDWDGRYTSTSRGAAAFELLLGHFARNLHGPEDLQIYSASWEPWELLKADLDELPRERLMRAVTRSLAAVRSELTRRPRWGDIHRLRLTHFLGSVPMIGRSYRFVDAPWSGSNETVMKAAHGFTVGRHAVKFGAIARHVSDFSDIDATWVAVLGGQDGWIGSAAFIDQFEMWRRGEYIRMPLRPGTIAEEFPHTTKLHPASGGG